VLTIGKMFVCSETGVTLQFVPAPYTSLYPLGTPTWRMHLLNLHRGHHLYKWVTCELDILPPSSANVTNDTCRFFWQIYSCHFNHIYIQVCKNPLRQVVEATVLCTLVPNICVSLVCNLPHFTLPALWISKWFLDFFPSKFVHPCLYLRCQELWFQKV
jgi:hypothetical protein